MFESLIAAAESNAVDVTREYTVTIFPVFNGVRREDLAESMTFDDRDAARAHVAEFAASFRYQTGVELFARRGEGQDIPYMYIPSRRDCTRVGKDYPAFYVNVRVATVRG